MRKTTLSRRIHLLQCAGLFLAMVSAAPLHAQTEKAPQVSIPMYQGADRTQRLIEGAKKEGSVTLYSSMTEKDTINIVKGFESKYGVKVKVWRSGKDKVLQRMIAEGQAGRESADIVFNVSPEMEALHREHLLQPSWSPFQKGLIPAALPQHGEWTGCVVYAFVQAYNPKNVSKEELPRTWEDLLDPRWKGRLSIEFKQQEWFYRLLTVMGEKKGLALFRKLVATNGLSIRSGSTLLSNTVMSGETDMALTMYSFLIDQGRAKGGQIESVALAPTIALTDGLGIPKQAPHPYAAALFLDFMLSDGQKILADNFIPTTREGDARMAVFPQLVYIDPAKVLDDYGRWTRLYDDTINNRGGKPR